MLGLSMIIYGRDNQIITLWEKLFDICVFTLALVMLGRAI